MDGYTVPSFHNEATHLSLNAQKNHLTGSNTLLQSVINQFLNCHHLQHSYLLCGLIHPSSSLVLNSFLILRSEHIINCLSISSAADQTLWNVTTHLCSRYISSVVLSSSHRRKCVSFRLQKDELLETISPSNVHAHALQKLLNAKDTQAILESSWL